MLYIYCITEQRELMNAFLPMKKENRCGGKS